MASKTADKSFVFLNQKKHRIRIDCKWYELKSEQVKSSESEGNVPKKLTHSEDAALRREAESLLNEDIAKYLEHQSNSRSKTDFNWIRVVLKKGALNDKLAAHTLLIEDSAVHNLRSVDELVKMTNSKGKREQILAMDHLKDIFIADLLPDHKLKPFAELVVNINSIEDKKKRETLLILAYVEDHIRTQYADFCHAIEKMSHDQVETTKSKAINAMYDLLASNPNEERFILEKIVNKIGMS